MAQTSGHLRLRKGPPARLKPHTPQLPRSQVSPVAPYSNTRMTRQRQTKGDRFALRGNQLSAEPRVERTVRVVSSTLRTGPAILCHLFRRGLDTLTAANIPRIMAFPYAVTMYCTALGSLSVSSRVCICRYKLDSPVPTPNVPTRSLL